MKNAGELMGMGAMCQANTGNVGQCRKMQGMPGNIRECMQSDRGMQGNPGVPGEHMGVCAKCQENAGECQENVWEWVQSAKGMPGERIGMGVK